MDQDPAKEEQSKGQSDPLFGHQDHPRHCSLLMPNNYWLRIYTITGLFVMLALGLNVVAGFAGC
jgi:hypothetical protein